MKNMTIKLIGVIWLIISLSLFSCYPAYLTTIKPEPPPGVQPIMHGELIEMPTYSVKGPSGEGWGVIPDKETGNIIFIKNKVSRVPELYTPQVVGRATIELLENRVLSQEKLPLGEDQFADDFVNTEEKKKREECIEKSYYVKPTSRSPLSIELTPFRHLKLENVSKGVTNIEGKKIYFFKYNLVDTQRYSEHITEVALYLFIPPHFKENHIFYTFKIEEIYQPEAGARKFHQVDLDQVLPVIKSFQIKTDGQ